MSDGFSALFWGVITFSLLVVIHEGGHFLLARLFGVKVHEFMVGLPGPAIRFHAKKTTYGITAIPLGGYVRIAGMEPGPEEPLLGPALAYITENGPTDAPRLAGALGVDVKKADELLAILADWYAIELDHEVDGERVYRSLHTPQEAQDPIALLDAARSITYRGLAFWKRLVVLSAGVVFNLLTAILVFTVVLSSFGYLEETGRIGEVAAGSAAAKAGVRVGDKITRIGDDPVKDWQSLVNAVSSNKPGDTVAIVVVRDGKTLTLSATLGERPETDSPLLGVSPELRTVTPGVFKSLALSFSYIGMTFAAIAGLFNPVTFQQTVSQSSSVIGASYMAADAAKAGAIDYASIIAMLSLSLGVINIVPIPPLDGGKVMLEVVERLRGKPLSRNLSLGLSATGAIGLFALIFYLMYADVVRFIVR